MPSVSADSTLKFVRQQGFPNADAAVCSYQFPALMFQPRAIAVAFLAGVVFQGWAVFVVLSSVLWWNVLLPRLNPFDALYNRMFARRRRIPPLTPATGPRRFAQAMAATTTLGVGISMLAGWAAAVWAFEALVTVALASLLLGRLCLGTYLFHVLRGNFAFANRTLPWSGPASTPEPR